MEFADHEYGGILPTFLRKGLSRKCGDRSNGKLVGSLRYLLLARFGNVEPLLCALNLGVAIASVQEAVRKVRKGFAIGEVSKFGELRGGKLALKPREAAGRDGGGSGESAAGAG
jgi:hypothetical protein